MRSQSADSFRSRVPPSVLYGSSITLGFHARCDSEEAILENRRSHSETVIFNPYEAPTCIVESFRVDDDLVCIRIVGVLDELNQCGRVSPDEELAKFAKKMGVYGKSGHISNLRSPNGDFSSMW